MRYLSPSALSAMLLPRLPLLLTMACCLLLLLSARVGLAQARIMDRVVAEVNGEIITLSQLERELAGAEAQILEQVAAAERENALQQARRQVLSGLIDRLLVEQHAARLRISVDEREIDEAIGQILTENGISLAELELDLQRHNSSLAAYRQELRAQILQSRLLNIEVRERVVIPENRIREYYRQNYTNRQQEDAYHILQIGFSWLAGSEDAREEARQKAQPLREEAVSGADFRDLARRYSELPSARDGGDLGLFRREELAGVMLETIPRLSPGEISPLIETAVGYQFFKLLSDRGDLRGQLSYEEAKSEIKEKLYRQALEEQFSRWVGNLREEAYIRVIL